MGGDFYSLKIFAYFKLIKFRRHRKISPPYITPFSSTMRRTAMQKHHLFFFSLVASVFIYPEYAQAALQFLPRYQGGYSGRDMDGGRDSVSITCASKGGVDKGANQTCTGAFSAGGKTCYKSCSCINGYRMSGSSCVAKSCPDYGYQSNSDPNKDCTARYPRSGLTCYECSNCDSSYKYSCSGALNASTQYGTQCASKYSRCSCVSDASWNASAGRCECDSNYKESYGSCLPKACEDYGLQANDDPGKDCTTSSPHYGLSCYNCESCGSSYQYNCSTIANANGGDGTACGGKYAKCKCKDLYSWGNGSCNLNCTKNSCSSTEYPLTTQGATEAVSYEECTPSCSNEPKRYKVIACSDGYIPNASGSGCKLSCTYSRTSCPDAYEITDSCTLHGTTYYKCELCHRPGGTAEGLYYCYNNDGKPSYGYTPTETVLTCGNKNYRRSCGCETATYLTRPKIDGNALCGERGYRGKYVNHESWYYRGYIKDACDENGKTVGVSKCSAYNCGSGYKVVEAESGTCGVNETVCCCPEGYTDTPDGSICTRPNTIGYDPADYN